MTDNFKKKIWKDEVRGLESKDELSIILRRGEETKKGREDGDVTSAKAEIFVSFPDIREIVA